jgi:hypothetical protein
MLHINGVCMCVENGKNEKERGTKVKKERKNILSLANLIISRSAIRR